MPAQQELEVNEAPRRRHSFSDQISSGYQRPKILSEKLIYYMSDFDLKINDWIQEQENLYLFKK